MRKEISILLLFVITGYMHAQPFPTNDIKIDFESSEYQEYITFDTSAYNIWQVGKPQKIFLSSGLGSENVIITDTVNSYPNNNESCFKISANWPKDTDYIAPATGINFYIKYDMDSFKVGVNIEFSLNDTIWYDCTTGIPPELLPVELGGYWYNFNDTVLSLNKPGFSGCSNTWLDLSFGFYLPDSDKDTVNLYYKFTFASDSVDNNKDGCMIDNITICYNDLLEEPPIGVFHNYIAKKSFQIYPNPAKNSINFKIDDELFPWGFNYKIINARGQVIEEKSINSFQDNLLKIYLNNYKPGIYLLMLSDKKRNVIRKFIIE